MGGLLLDQRGVGGAREEKASVRAGRYVQTAQTGSCVVEAGAWTTGGAPTSALPACVAAMHSAQIFPCGAEAGSSLERAEAVGCVRAWAITPC